MNIYKARTIANDVPGDWTDTERHCALVRLQNQLCNESNYASTITKVMDKRRVRNLCDYFNNAAILDFNPEVSERHVVSVVLGKDGDARVMLDDGSRLGGVLRTSAYGIDYWEGETKVELTVLVGEPR